MTSEQPPKDALRPLRPLPSVDIPLLREERIAVRSRRVLVALLAAGAVLGGAGVLVASYRSQNAERSLSDSVPSDAEDPFGAEAASEGAPTLGGTTPEAATPTLVGAVAAPAPVVLRPSPEPQVSLPPVDSRAVTRIQRSFGRALSFRDGLERNGLSRDEANAVISGLTPVMDFRRSQPDDLLSMERDSAGTLVRFEYRSGLTLRYEARRSDAGAFEGRQIHVPIRQVRVAKGGVVSGSLGDALEGLKLGRAMTGVFTEVFEGRINFSTDPRAGDTFRIIYDDEFVEDAFLRHGTVHAVEYQGSKAGKFTAFWHGTKGEDGDFYDASGRAMQGGWLRTPLRYDHISSPFGTRFHPVLKRKLLHNGIDYAASTGTLVRAAATGTIRFIGPKGANGNLIAIEHAQGYETFYAHLSRFVPGLKAGSKVQQRQPIAYVGSTGRSTGAHLHFSLKRGGKIIDPSSQLNGPGLPLTAKEAQEFKRRVRDLSAALGRIVIEKPAPVAARVVDPSPVDMSEDDL